MNIPKPDFAVTPYGDVDAAQLEQLRHNFNTSVLLTLSDKVVSVHIHEVRDELLRLHRMAHTVINGASLSEPAGEDLWEVASSLIDELRHVADSYRAIASVLEPLARLRPNGGP